MCMIYLYKKLYICYTIYILCAIKMGLSKFQNFREGFVKVKGFQIPNFVVMIFQSLNKERTFLIKHDTFVFNMLTYLGHYEFPCFSKHDYANQHLLVV